MPSSYTTDDLVSGHEYGWYNDHWRLGMTRSGNSAGADFVIQLNAARRLSLTSGGNLSVTGTIGATNFSGTHSGSSSGTNTGDQTNISGNAATVTNATFYRQFTVRDDRSDGGNYNLSGRATGLYAIESSGSNGPGSGYLSLIHVANGTDVAFQIAGGYTSDSMYFRGTSALQNGTGYSAWRTVIHSGNIGSQTVATAGALSSMNISQFTNNSGYITSYTETDTLATVTARGATTSTETIFTGTLKTRKSQTAGDYTTAALWTESHSNTATGIAFHISGVKGTYLEMRTNQVLYWDGNTVYHSGNIPTWNQNTTGTSSNVSGTVAVVNGGTGATDAATARTNLGLAIGTNVLAYRTFGTAASNNTGDFVLSKAQSNWLSTGVIDNVVGLLAWKNYGNSHVIFDASASTNPSGGGCSSTNATTPWVATYPTLMGWNGSTTYGVRVDSARVADSAASATTAGALSSMNISQFTNNSGYITSDSTKLPLAGGTMTGTITITNTDIRSNSTSNWTGDPGTQGKIQYHSSRWYIVADSASDRIVQFRRNGTDVSYIDNSGNFIGNASTATTATTAGSAPNASNLNSMYGVSTGNGNGLKFWGGSDTYKIHMGNAAEYWYGPVTDYSIKCNIDSVGSTRGFTWGQSGVTPIAALNVGNGNMQIAGTFTTGGSILPLTNNSVNLGSATYGWANVYTNDLHLSNMSKPEGNDIDGTNGTWTIQEGLENLYIINNNNGEKFKIVLEKI